MQAKKPIPYGGRAQQLKAQGIAPKAIPTIGNRKRVTVPSKKTK